MIDDTLTCTRMTPGKPDIAVTYSRFFVIILPCVCYFRIPLLRLNMTVIKETLSQLSHIYVGGGMLFNHLNYNVPVWIETRGSIFLMAVSDVLPGIQDVLSQSPTSSQISREQKHNYFSRIVESNNIICLQEEHGKDEFSQAIQVLDPRSRLFGTFTPSHFLMQVVQACAFIKTYCLAMLS